MAETTLDLPSSIYLSQHKGEKTKYCVNTKSDVMNIKCIESDSLDKEAFFSTTNLSIFRERHIIGELPRQEIDPSEDVHGLVFISKRGLVSPAGIKVLQRELKTKDVWLFWQKEGAIEKVDNFIIKNLKAQLLAKKISHIVSKISWLKKLPRRLFRLTKSNLKMLYHFNMVLIGKPSKLMELTYDYIFAGDRFIEPITEEVRVLTISARPHQLDFTDLKNKKVAYLRLDFWARINCGGSYGHTCYVANELNKKFKECVCFMPEEYLLLNKLNVSQVLLGQASPFSTENHILRANDFYYEALKNHLSEMKPQYIYERLVLGSHTGAKLSQELKIPYIVEYNGSEIVMKKTGDGKPYTTEELFLSQELLAFKQASLITVISEVVKADLIQRGVDESKIIVNPNGVEPNIYSPADPQTKRELREDIGLAQDDIVVGFIGTYGFWHGIEVIANSLKEICELSPKVKWLFIGEGHFLHLLKNKVTEWSLQNQIIFTGKVAQMDGANLLKTCDIFVNPTNSFMAGSRFFGSPTKLFEYMSLSGAIVASDLEQVGQILRPALSSKQLDSKVDLQRAILFPPGNGSEFTASVKFLIENPEVRERLGRNAKEAAHAALTWSHHVDRIIEKSDFFEKYSKDAKHPQKIKFETQDYYKKETQAQWDSDPCGSHYVKDSEKGTKEWFQKVEDYRYKHYGPWMPEIMEFNEHPGKQVLEIGAGLGTDLAQFAKAGSLVTDLDLSNGHLALAKKNFEHRGLKGVFVNGDCENMAFENNSFDIVYSNGVIHHTPNTQTVVDEIYRVLKPGGKAIIMVYASSSLHYWQNLFYEIGFKRGRLEKSSMGDIMSEFVEISEHGSKPLVKAYTKKSLGHLFKDFRNTTIYKRQLLREELPFFLRPFSVDYLSRLIGWNLVIKAYKPK